MVHAQLCDLRRLCFRNAGDVRAYVPCVSFARAAGGGRAEDGIVEPCAGLPAGDLRQAGMAYVRRFFRAVQGFSGAVIVEFFGRWIVPIWRN
jgi:hypothetical protein